MAKKYKIEIVDGNNSNRRSSKEVTVDNSWELNPFVSKAMDEADVDYIGEVHVTYIEYVEKSS